jgi:isopentenyl phosphate kinase
MTVVLKLGGSVLTEKDEPETVDETALDSAATAVAGTDGRLVVVHGGGSFGHHHADRHGVSTTAGTRTAGAVTDIHGAMKRLNDAVVARFQAAGVSAVPVHPFSLAARTETGELRLPVESVTTMLGEGFVPVLHGDVVGHAGAGVTVLSGDELVVALADALGVDRVGLCSAVPGVLDEDGEVIPRIDEFGAVADVLGASDATDVTGGMAGKVETLLALSAPATIFGLDALDAFLGGATPGTVVGGPRPSSGRE